MRQWCRVFAPGRACYVFERCAPYAKRLWASICLRCMTNLNIISHWVFFLSFTLHLLSPAPPGYQFSQTIGCLHKLSLLLCAYKREDNKKDRQLKKDRAKQSEMQREGGRGRPSTSREKVRSHAVGMLVVVGGGLLAWLPHFSQP